MNSSEKKYTRGMTAYNITTSLHSHMFDSEEGLDEDDFSIIYRMFNTVGGSWERVVGGSVEDFELLKSVLVSYEKIKAEALNEQEAGKSSSSR